MDKNYSLFETLVEDLLEKGVKVEDLINIILQKKKTIKNADILDAIMKERLVSW